MQFLNLLKFKKSKPLQSNLSEIKKFLPNGEADIGAGTNELLLILNNSIDEQEAREVFINCFMMSKLPLRLDRERLEKHLESNNIHHFNNVQMDKFLSYLTALTVAMNIFGCSPNDVERDGDGYIW